MERTLIKSSFVIPSFHEPKVIRDGAIILEEDLIKWVGQASDLPNGSFDHTIDAKGQLAVPGFVNGHTHIFHTFGRTLGADRTFESWVKDIEHKMLKEMTPDDLQITYKLACIEMIRSGITTAVDNREMHNSYEAIDKDAETISKVGLRCIVARGIRERTPRMEKMKIAEWVTPYSLKENLNITEQLIRKWNSPSDSMVKIWPAPVALSNITREGLLRVKELSDKFGTGIHSHVAETWIDQVNSVEDFGCREVELLHELDILGPLMNIVHGVWLTRREIKLIAESNSSVIHCPISNSYVAEGIAEVAAMLRYGINVGIGTDGDLCNDVSDIFEVTKTAALIQKAATLDPMAVTTLDALRMGTSNGATAIGMQENVGTLQAGKKADVVLIDLKKAHLTPMYNIFNLLVYCVRGSDVNTVFVNGNPVLLNGKITTIDENEVIEEMNRRTSEIKVSGA
ncbi:MAG TPA: amidohydrolase [Candidatus Bathyarchaeia archaeon]|nr:amidohydrolase [Candidatus Bathyarchaeia archaeon]